MRITFVAISYENLGVSQLSALARLAGHRVNLAFSPCLFNDRLHISLPSLARCFDETDLILEKIESQAPDVLAFSPLSGMYQWALDIARRAKEARPGLKTIFGGIHTSAVPQRVIVRPEVDYLCVGEGDAVFLEILDHVRRGTERPIDNTWYKTSDGRVIRGVQRGFIQDLNALPIPDKILWENDIPHNNFYITSAMRGCPNRCVYCFNSFYAALPREHSGPYLRRRSPQHVLHELRTYHQRYRFRVVEFFDDVFTLDPVWLREFARRYRREIGVPYQIFTHVNAVDEERARMLADSGCIAAQIGVQSLDDDYKRRVLNRRETSEQVGRAIDVLTRFGVRAKMDHMLGLPGEPVEAQDKAIQFYARHTPYRIQTYWTNYFPGTKMLEQAQAQGRLSPQDADKLRDGYDMDTFSRANAMIPPEKVKIYQACEWIYKLLPHLPLGLRRKLSYHTVIWMPRGLLFCLAFFTDMILGLVKCDRDHLFYAWNYWRWMMRHVCWRFKIPFQGMTRCYSQEPVVWSLPDDAVKQQEGVVVKEYAEVNHYRRTERMKSLGKWTDQILQHQRPALLVLAVVTIGVFINSLSNKFIMDDFDFITNWTLIQNLENLPRFFVGYIPPESQAGVYSPLRTLIFALEYGLFRDWAPGWHGMAIIIHGLGVWAVYCLTQILAGSRRLSFVSALIFAVHPVHVESVTAVTGSVDTAGVVLGLWAFYWYIRAVLPSGRLSVFDGAAWPRGRDAKHTIAWRFYGVSCLLGVLAVWTHELILTLPALIMMLDMLFLGPRVSFRRAFVRALPFFVMVLFYIGAKHVVLGSIARGTYIFDQPYLTVLVVIKAWAKYVGVLLVPLVLTHNKIISDGIMSFDPEDFDRAAFFAQSWHDPQVVLSFMVLAGILVSGIVLYRKRPLISFGIFWFFLSLAPVSQIVPSAVYYAERYLYPGSWSYAMIAAWGFWALYQRFSAQGVGRKVLIAVMTVIVMGYGARTIIRNRDLKDWVTLYSRAVEMNPQSAYLKNDLAILLSRAGDFESAHSYFSEALKIQPDNAHFYFSLAEMYASFGRDRQALAALEKALELDPEFPEAYFNLAGAMVFEGQRQQGLAYLEQAVELWKERGQVLEAGEAMSTFFVFIAQQDGALPKDAAQEFLKYYVQD